MSEPARIILIGCGGRGTVYARLTQKYPSLARIVAVADPREFYRNQIGNECNLPTAMRFRSYEEVIRLPKFADAVMICTQDNLHEAPAIAFANLGYHLMLEKPLAPTEAACQRIVDAATNNRLIFAVCHVLRYTEYTRMTKELIAKGTIGEPVNIQHLEPVGYWHQAHSFVRGNWRNEAASSSMLLQKCCHDLDWIRYVMDRPCRQVQSFGSLFLFRPEMKPAGAAERCMYCPESIEENCPYSARKIYLRDRVEKNNFGWPTDVLTPEPDMAAVENALREGPYGRCVYACDNDVVDHQIVNMVFAEGRTASHTMTAFTPNRARMTRICGTRGYIETDSTHFRIVDFLTDRETLIDMEQQNDGGIRSGHGGGDEGLVRAFLNAVFHNDPKCILSGPEVSLESHRMVFAAERSRKNGTVETL